MDRRVVKCPICSRSVPEESINSHLDNDCSDASTSAANPKRNIKASIPTQRSKGHSLAPIFASGKSKATSSSTSTPSHIQKDISTSSAQKRRQEDDSCSAQPGPSKKSRPTGAAHISSAAPLAEKLRPQRLEEFIGQPHLTGPDSLLMSLLRGGSPGSMIFWGPPGCGKTTLARLLAKRTDAVFKELSATDSGISDVRSVAEEAKGALKLTGRRTILFLDEVHRFNKGQQDIFLPFIEQGIIQLIGATTENPSFKLTGALLSRCRVFVLERLSDENITQIITQAVWRVSSKNETFQNEHTQLMDGLEAHAEITSVSSPTMPSSPLPPPSSLSQNDGLSQASNSTHSTALTVPEPQFPAFPQFTPKIFSSMVSLSSGDARTALSLLELVLSAPTTSDPDKLLASLRRSVSTSYDRTGDDRYDMISALHKSVRGSQGSAALYWLARMLNVGEDPLYIARRMVVCASEDVGLADNHALPLAIATYQACQVIGMPECRINLAHLVGYLSEAPKSTRSYQGYNRAEEAAKSDPVAPVPLMVRNAPTALMKGMGYGHDYAYNPDYAHPVTNDYLPGQFRGDVFLKPEGDTSDRIWDEAALRRWEMEENGGEEWEGRHARTTEENEGCL